MGEEKMRREIWCNEELLNTREELEKLREDMKCADRLNYHLSNRLDKKTDQIDEIRGTIQKMVTGKISTGIAMDDVMRIVGWRR